MKIAPVSGDFLVKLGLGVVVLGGAAALIWAYKERAQKAAGDLVTAFNPTSPENVAYQTINTWGGNLTTDPMGPGKYADGSWSLGAWLYDVSHPFQTMELANITRTTP